jgi:hypothetical protein
MWADVNSPQYSVRLCDHGQIPEDTDSVPWRNMSYSLTVTIVETRFRETTDASNQFQLERQESIGSLSLHHCDKISEQLNLKEQRFIRLQFQSMVAWPHCCGLVLRQNIMVVRVW